MNRIFQINLSSGEIYVLAGLLHYNSVTGVETETLKLWQNDVLKHIKHTVSRLEKKKVIFCEFDGFLYIDSNIHLITDCLCNPDYIGVVSGSIKNGKNKTMYILYKNGFTVLLSRLDSDTYKITLYSDLNIGDVVADRLAENNQNEIHEKILFEEAEFIKEQVISFKLDEAKNNLKKLLHSDKTADSLINAFSEKSSFLKIQTYFRKEDVYIYQFDCLVITQDSQNLRLTLDNHNVLNIDSVGKSDLIKLLNTKFSEGITR